MTSTTFRGVTVPIEPLDASVQGRDGYAGLNPRSETLPKGWKHPHPDSRPLPCDIRVDHDVAIKVRDGVTLYADVLRPPTSEKVPALICWSPFGKKFNGLLSLGYMTPWKLGVPSGTLSGLEKFEAPDPADWVPRGYAIVNVERGGPSTAAGPWSSWARRRPRTATTRSRPWPPWNGAPARSGSRATRTSPSRSGSSLHCGRPASSPSRRGRAAGTCTASSLPAGASTPGTCSTGSSSSTCSRAATGSRASGRCTSGTPSRTRGGTTSGRT